MPTLEMKYYGASVLKREAKLIKTINKDILQLASDMLETMYQHHGVGLAAPQVGISKQLLIVDCGKEYQPKPYFLINPVVVHTEGSQIGPEGCLSLPGLFLDVERPYNVIVQAIDLQGQQQEIIGEELLARAILHEIDHLKGKIFTEFVLNREELASKLPLLKERIHGILNGELSAIPPYAEEEQTAVSEQQSDKNNLALLKVDR